MDVNEEGIHVHMKDCSWPLYSFHNRPKEGGITFSPYQIHHVDADTEKSEEYKKWKEGDTRPPGPEKIDQSMSQQTSGGRPAHMMGFSDAVQNVVMNNYANWDGRASRSEYWWFVLFGALVGFVTGTIDGFLFGWEYSDPTWISTLVSLALLLPNFCVSVRRLHDLGKSGWWNLLVFTIIGIIPLLIFMVMEGEEHPNQYGEVPTNTLEHDANIHTNY
jgi:uncharacterized membrane protein YhaH (DUF805 family)